MANQLSLTAVLPLAKLLATASCHRSNTGLWITIKLLSHQYGNAHKKNNIVFITGILIPWNIFILKWALTALDHCVGYSIVFRTTVTTYVDPYLCSVWYHAEEYISILCISSTSYMLIYINIYSYIHQHSCTFSLLVDILWQTVQI